MQAAEQRRELAVSQLSSEPETGLPAFLGYC